MAWLTRDEVKEIVCDSLNEIGNFNGDCEEILIAELDDVYIIELGNSIQDKLREKGFTVTLSIPIIKDIEKISGLINYINEHQLQL